MSQRKLFPEPFWFTGRKTRRGVTAVGIHAIARSLSLLVCSSRIARCSSARGAGSVFCRRCAWLGSVLYGFSSVLFLVCFSCGACLLLLGRVVRARKRVLPHRVAVLLWGQGRCSRRVLRATITHARHTAPNRLWTSRSSTD